MSLLVGIVIGTFVSYAWWRLPLHVDSLQQWRRRKVRTEVDRIRGGFTPRIYIPNTPPPMYLGERILEYLNRWWEDFHDEIRTPEGVAEATYREMLRS